MNPDQRDISAPILAFDVGGTRIKAGLLDGNVRRVLGQQTEKTPDSISEVFEVMTSLGRELARDAAVSACGVSVPGLVRDGIVTDLPGKLDGIVGIDVGAQLRPLTFGPVVVANDAVAYALGEAVFGAGAGYERVVVMTIGTGVGVTVIEQNKPLGTGELGGGILGGMIPISESDTYVDSGGNPGSIEALCSAQRIVDYAKSAGCQQDSVEAVYADFQEGSRSARAGVDRYRLHLVRALSAIAHAHAPQAIVLGGGPMTPDNPVTIGLEAELSRRLWGGFKVQLKLSELGDAAALWGLAHLCEQAGLT